jgi:polysaccharide deacetylase family protein (PEP-CTERM system associated)
MNVLTFDIEEWYLESVKTGRKEKYEEFDRYLEAILNKLDERSIQATFFCVGEMGRLFPEVVRKIQGRGHEIGCHSNIHTWLDKMQPDECREDTRIAVDSLEQCIGKKVKSYRAPAFSITSKNPWAFEILAENGIEMDASVFPAVRDFGGFPEFNSTTPVIVSYKGINIKEFPVCPINWWGRQIVYSGGGYFRFFPKVYINKKLKKSEYVMMYFHISDLSGYKEQFMSKITYEEYYKESGTLFNRMKRYFKDNFAFGNTFNKFQSIMSGVRFSNLEQVDKEINWKKSINIQ